ncbi:hypothetical protein [Algibacter sp. 2305UL17-15]|uniref:hypothetical protein n=1 Tax=Algibacter sp. 2305UL17-15 TaxID=3231268 RepID=UPI0034596AD0
MKSELNKYIILTLIYVLSVFLVELHTNIIARGVWLISILLCLIGLIRLLLKKRNLTQKLLPILLLSIPILDLTFGITNKIRNEIKGEIVLDIIDDSFATTKNLTVRERNGKLTAEFYNSFAGFGDMEIAKTELLNDSTLAFKLSERNYSENLTFDRQKQNFRNKEKNLNYRILKNELFK